MEPRQPTDETEPWWGTFFLDENTGGRWEVGPSTVWLYRTAHEWRVLHRPTADPQATDPMANRSNATVPVPEADMSEGFDSANDDLQISRYSFRRTNGRVVLQPALADRPVVSRPEHPLYVPPGELVTLYLSTAVWIRVELAESGSLLQELPSYRMSDTWFGASTTQGELCYATRTAGRLQLENLPRRFHRAVTPLRIKNTGTDALALERVQLPVEYLALYTTPTHGLWTPAVTMTRSEGHQGAGIQIRSGPPTDAKGAELLREPRKTDKRGLFISTFSAVGTLFGS